MIPQCPALPAALSFCKLSQRVRRSPRLLRPPELLGCVLVLSILSLLCLLCLPFFSFGALSPWPRSTAPAIPPPVPSYLSVSITLSIHTRAATSTWSAPLFFLPQSARSRFFLPAIAVTVRLSEGLTSAQLAARVSSTDNLTVLFDSSRTTSWASLVCNTLALQSPPSGEAPADLTIAGATVPSGVTIEGGPTGTTIKLDNLSVGALSSGTAPLLLTAVDVYEAFAGTLTVSSSTLGAENEGIRFSGAVGLVVSGTTIDARGRPSVGINVTTMPTRTLSIEGNTINATVHGVHVVGPSTAGDDVPATVRITRNTVAISNVLQGDISNQIGFASGVTVGTSAQPMVGKVAMALVQRTIAHLVELSHNVVDVTTMRSVSCVGLSFVGSRRQSDPFVFTAVNLTVSYNRVTLLPTPSVVLTLEPNHIRVMGATVVTFTLNHNTLLAPELLNHYGFYTHKSNKRFRGCWVAFVVVAFEERMAQLPNGAAMGFVRAPATISHNVVNLTAVRQAGTGYNAINGVCIGKGGFLNNTAALCAFTTGLHVDDNDVRINGLEGEPKLIVYEDVVVQAPFITMSRNTLRGVCLNACNVTYGLVLWPPADIPSVAFVDNNIITTGSRLSVPIRLDAQFLEGRFITSFKTNLTVHGNYLFSNSSGPSFAGRIVLCGVQADGGMADTNTTVTGNTFISAGLGKSQSVALLLVPVDTASVVIANNTIDERSSSLASAVLLPYVTGVRRIEITDNDIILVAGVGVSAVSFPTSLHNTTSVVFARNKIRFVANPTVSIVVGVDIHNVEEISITDNSVVGSLDTPDPSWCHYPRPKLAFALFMSYDPGLTQRYFNPAAERLQDVRRIRIASNTVAVTAPCGVAVFGTQFLMENISVLIENNTVSARPPSWAGPAVCDTFDACIGETRNTTVQEDAQLLPMATKMARFMVLGRGILLSPISRSINTTAGSVVAVYGDVGPSNNFVLQSNTLSFLSGAPIETAASGSGAPVISSAGTAATCTEQQVGTWVDAPTDGQVQQAEAAVLDQRSFPADMALVECGMDNVLSSAPITGDRVGAALTGLPVVDVRSNSNRAFFTGGRVGAIVVFTGAPDYRHGGRPMPGHTAFMFGAHVTSTDDELCSRASSAVSALAASVRAVNTTSRPPAMTSDRFLFDLRRARADLHTAGAEGVIALVVRQQIGAVRIADSHISGGFGGTLSQPPSTPTMPGYHNTGSRITGQISSTVAVVAVAMVPPTFAADTAAASPTSSSTLKVNAATMDVFVNATAMNISAPSSQGSTVRPQILSVREPGAAPPTVPGYTATRPVALVLLRTRVQLFDETFGNVSGTAALITLPRTSPVWASRLTNFTFKRALLSNRPRLFESSSVPPLSTAGTTTARLSCSAMSTFLRHTNRTVFSKVTEGFLQKTQYEDTGILPAGLSVTTDCDSDDYCVFPFDHVDPLALGCISFTATRTASPTLAVTSSLSSTATATGNATGTATLERSHSVSTSASATFLPAQLVAVEGPTVLYSALLAADPNTRVLRVGITNSTDSFDTNLQQDSVSAPRRMQADLSRCSVSTVLYDEDLVPPNERMSSEEEAAFLRGERGAVSVFAAVRATLRNASLLLSAANGSSAGIDLPRLLNIPNAPTVAGDGPRFAPLHRTVRFAVSVSRRCFAKRSEATVVNFTIPATAEPAAPQVVGALALGATSAGSAVSAALGSGATGPVAVRLGALAAMAACDMGDPEPPDIAASPTQRGLGSDRVRFQLGTAVFDTAIVVGAFALNLFAAVVASMWGRCSFMEGCARAQFPSLSAFPFLFFLQPVLEAAAIAAIFGEAFTSRLIGAAVAVAHSAVFAAIVYLLVFDFRAAFEHTVPQPAPRASCALGWRTFFRYAGWATQGKGEWVDLQVVPRRLDAALLVGNDNDNDSTDEFPDTRCAKEVEGASFVQRYALLFGDYTDRCRWFFLIEGAIALVLAAVSVIAVSVGCEVTSWLLAVTFAAHFAALMYSRCFVSVANFGFVAALSLLQCIVAVLIAVDAQLAVAAPNDGGHLLTAVEEERESVWLTAAEYLILCIAFTTAARAVFDIAEMVFAVATAYAGPAASRLKKLWFWRPEWSASLAFADPSNGHGSSRLSAPRDFSGDPWPVETHDGTALCSLALHSNDAGSSDEEMVPLPSARPAPVKRATCCRTPAFNAEIDAFRKLNATLAEIDAERRRAQEIESLLQQPYGRLPSAVPIGPLSIGSVPRQPSGRAASKPKPSAVRLSRRIDLTGHAGLPPLRATEEALPQ